MVCGCFGTVHRQSIYMIGLISPYWSKIEAALMIRFWINSNFSASMLNQTRVCRVRSIWHTNVPTRPLSLSPLLNLHLFSKSTLILKKISLYSFWNGCPAGSNSFIIVFCVISQGSTQCSLWNWQKYTIIMIIFLSPISNFYLFLLRMA